MKYNFALVQHAKITYSLFHFENLNLKFYALEYKFNANLLAMSNVCCQFCNEAILLLKLSDKHFGRWAGDKI